MSDQPKPATGDIGARITEYLAAGGLFNPELMEHEKVRDLLMDCRAALAAAKPKTTEYAQGWDDHVLAARSQIEDLQQQLAEEQKNIALHNRLIDLEEQLAAERSKVQELEERLKAYDQHRSV